MLCSLLLSSMNLQFFMLRQCPKSRSKHDNVENVQFSKFVLSIKVPPKLAPQKVQLRKSEHDMQQLYKLVSVKFEFRKMASEILAPLRLLLLKSA